MKVNGPFEANSHYIPASVMSHGEKVSVCQSGFPQDKVKHKNDFHSDISSLARRWWRGPMSGCYEAETGRRGPAAPAASSDPSRGFYISQSSRPPNCHKPPPPPPCSRRCCPDPRPRLGRGKIFSTFQKTIWHFAYSPHHQ